MRQLALLTWKWSVLARRRTHEYTYSVSVVEGAIGLVIYGRNHAKRDLAGKCWLSITVIRWGETTEPYHEQGIIYWA